VVKREGPGRTEAFPARTRAGSRGRDTRVATPAAPDRALFDDLI